MPKILSSKDKLRLDPYKKGDSTGDKSQINTEPPEGAVIMTNDDDAMGANPRIRQYPDKSVGPFTVFIRNVGKPFSEVKLAKQLTAKYKSIRHVRAMNQFKLVVILNEKEEANKMPKDEDLKEFRVYIPASTVEIDGRIRLSTESSQEQLMEHGSGIFIGGSEKVKILDVYRHKYKGENDKLEDSTNVVITFEGTKLPDFIATPEGLYIPINRKNIKKDMFCVKCQREGHTQGTCSNKCRKCSQPHQEKDCRLSEPIRKSCDGNHYTGSNECDVRKEKFNRKVVRETRTGNRFEILTNDKEVPTFQLDGKDFPAITRRDRVAAHVMNKVRTQVVEEESPGPSKRR